MNRTRRSFLGSLSGGVAALAYQRKPLNFLLITADDMNYNSPNCFGGKVPNLTPNIDKLSSQGMRFDYAHVTVAVCQPSRSALMTGRYPHRNGAEGFNPIREDVPTLQESLDKAGYMKGIFAKTEHLQPVAKFHWDTFVPVKDIQAGRNPALYHQRATKFFTDAKAAGKPFFLMANSADPHRPFAGSDQELKMFGKHMDYTREIKPQEAVIPGFLPDIPGVRKEVAQYLTSVHRCDQTVGQVLKALEESGMAENTVVMFLSDNGMSFPFSKTNCYLTSTKTPWIVRWPGKTRPGSVEKQHFISGIDFTPTILELAGLPPISGVDGRSFAPLLTGGKQSGREVVYTVFHETSGHQRYEMRCLQDKKYGYIFNPWSDGKRIFKNESQAGLSFKAMQEAADSNAEIAKRVDLFVKRVPEEFYDFESDPDALKNLIGDPKYKTRIDDFRRRMREHLAATSDPVLAAFNSRNPPA